MQLSLHSKTRLTSSILDLNRFIMIIGAGCAHFKGTLDQFHLWHVPFFVRGKGVSKRNDGRNFRNLDSLSSDMYLIYYDCSVNPLSQ